MKPIPTPSTSRSERSDRVRRAPVLLALTLLLMGFQAAAEEPIAAVWKVREVDFLYRSSMAIFSCRALEGRVATILRAIGARDDVQVRASNCQESVVPQVQSANTWETPSDRLRNRNARAEQLAHVRVRLMMPIEVTEEVLAELERDRARRELVSRVTDDPAAMFDNPIVFTAQRQPVTLSRRSIGLEPAECELLEQMSTSVFRALDVRVVRKGALCSRNRISRIPPELTVEAIIGTPVATGTTPQMPAAGEGEGDSNAPAASETGSSDPASATPRE